MFTGLLHDAVKFSGHLCHQKPSDPHKAPESRAYLEPILTIPKQAQVVAYDLSPKLVALAQKEAYGVWEGSVDNSFTD